MYDFSKKGVSDLAASLNAEWGDIWDSIGDGGREQIKITIDGRAIQVPVCADNCNAIVYLLKDMLISEMTGEATIGNTRTAYDEQEIKFNSLDGDIHAPSPSEPPLTPAEKALDEPDVFDSAEVAALRDELFRRFDKNLADYFDAFQNPNIMVLGDMSSEIAAMTGAYAYMTGMHNFHTSELEYLLQFKNPLKVVADEFEWDAATESRSDITWKIFHDQEALKNGKHELLPDASAEDALKQELFERLDANMSDYREGMLNGSKADIFDMAEDIASRYAAREYMTTAYDYKTGEVEFLLQFQDPLSLIAEGWPGMMDAPVNIPDIMEIRGTHGHYAKVMDADHPAANESARSTADIEKPSVLDRIREAAKLPKVPRKDKPQRDITGPEL